MIHSISLFIFSHVLFMVSWFHLLLSHFFNKYKYVRNKKNLIFIGKYFQKMKDTCKITPIGQIILSNKEMEKWEVESSYFSFIFISKWWANFEFPSTGSVSSAIRCGTQVIGWTKPWRRTISTICKKKKSLFSTLKWKAGKCRNQLN